MKVFKLRIYAKVEIPCIMQIPRLGPRPDGYLKEVPGIDFEALNM